MSHDIDKISKTHTWRQVGFGSPCVAHFRCALCGMGGLCVPPKSDDYNKPVNTDLVDIIPTDYENDIYSPMKYWTCEEMAVVVVHNS
jgi:hypothetical protein